jgi:hypothetical protein
MDGKPASSTSIARAWISQDVWLRVQQRRARDIHRHAASDVAEAVEVLSRATPVGISALNVLGARGAREICSPV